MEVIMPMIAVVSAVITFAIYIVDKNSDGTEHNK